MTDTDLAIRLVVSCLLGGLIGFEREAKGHAAGLRTYILVCLGSTLFMIAGELITQRYAGFNPPPDPSRIASTIVTGVGFLGAGVIFQSRTRVRNLTTAAGIWVVAAIGMLVGAGFFIGATAGTLIAFLVLLGLPPVEGWINRRFRPGSRGQPDDNVLLPDEQEGDGEPRDAR
jgi:putative Mg2+ transporter-C (MgtC) family protein